MDKGPRYFAPGYTTPESLRLTNITVETFSVYALIFYAMDFNHSMGGLTDGQADRHTGRQTVEDEYIDRCR